MEGVKTKTSSRKFTASDDRPTPWGPIQEQKAMQSLLPDGKKLPRAKAKTPLYSCVKAWMALAKWRGETGPSPDKLARIKGLGVLEQPFPKQVGEAITTEFDSLVKSGLVKGYRQSDRSVWYRVADHGNLLLLRQREDNAQSHLVAAQAWQRVLDPKLRAQQISRHRVLAGESSTRSMLATINYAIEREDYAWRNNG